MILPVIAAMLFLIVVVIAFMMFNFGSLYKLLFVDNIYFLSGMQICNKKNSTNNLSKPNVLILNGSVFKVVAKRFYKEYNFYTAFSIYTDCTIAKVASENNGYGYVPLLKFSPATIKKGRD